MIVWMVLLWILLSVLPVTATTYYAAPGSNITSCSTAQGQNTGGDLVTMVNNCWRNPGDTLILRGGTYSNTNLHGFVNTNWPAGGTDFGAGAMTLAAYPGEVPVISPPGTAEAIIMIRNGWESGWNIQYIIIDGITFNAPNATAIVVKIDLGTRFIRFSNNTILGSLHATCNCFGFGQSVSYPNSGSYGMEVLKNNISGCAGYGIYANGTQSLFDGNEVHHNIGYAFHLWYDQHAELVDGNVIRNNTIHHNNIGGSGSGSVGTANTMIISGSDNYIYNNLFYANGDGTYLDSVVEMRAADGINYLWNNTIADNLNNVACIRDGDGKRVVQGNICAGNSTNMIKQDAPGSTIDHNVSVADGGFVNATAGNYRLTSGSPGINAGVNLTTGGIFTTDITGATRPPPPGFWDAGAYEAEGSGGSPLLPSTGIFFMAQGGSNTTDCAAAKGTVGTPSAAPFGDYNIARQCMQPPWTLYMRGGTYSGINTQVTPFIGGTSEATRGVIARYPGETVVLQSGGQNDTSVPTVYMRNPATDTFITLKELIIENGSNGVALVGSSNILLDGVEVRNTWYEGVFASATAKLTVQGGKVHDSAYNGTALIGLDGTSDTTVIGVEVYGGASVGIGSYGGNSNLLVQKSTIRNNAAEGIAIGNGTGLKVQNNIVQQNSIGVHVLANETGAQIEYNTIWGSVNSCMVLEGGVSATVVDNICNQQAGIINNAGASVIFTSNSCTGVAGCDTAAPLFTSVVPGNPGFLHLAVGSPARDSGVVVPGLTQDITGRARPTGTGVDKPDRGVYEEVYQAAGGGGAPPPAVIQPGRTSMHLVW